MRLHYYVLIILVKIWPKLFDRYFSEYQDIFFIYRKKTTKKLIENKASVENGETKNG